MIPRAIAGQRDGAPARVRMAAFCAAYRERTASRASGAILHMEVVTSVSTRGRQRALRGGRVRRLSIALMALGGLMLFASAARGAGPEVVVLPTTGIVDEGMSKYLADNINLANERGVAAVVIKLNTPGGSLASMQGITATIL